MDCLKKYLCCCCSAPPPSPPVSTFVSVAETKSPAGSTDREMAQVQASVAARFTNIGLRAQAIREHVTAWTSKKITIGLVLDHMIDQSHKATLITEGFSKYSHAWTKDGRDSLHTGLGIMEEELDLMEESMKLIPDEVKDIST